MTASQKTHIYREAKIEASTAHQFDHLPACAFVRLKVVRILYACSSATIWRRVKHGSLPSPVKLGPNHTAWSVADLREDLSLRRSSSS